MLLLNPLPGSRSQVLPVRLSGPTHTCGRDPAGANASTLLLPVWNECQRSVSIIGDWPGEDLTDVDLDGFSGGPEGTDCDDNAAHTYPNAIELEDAQDNNCDGFIDEQPTTGQRQCLDGHLFQ